MLTAPPLCLSFIPPSDTPYSPPCLGAGSRAGLHGGAGLRPPLCLHAPLGPDLWRVLFPAALGLLAQWVRILWHLIGWLVVQGRTWLPLRPSPDFLGIIFEVPGWVQAWGAAPPLIILPMSLGGGACRESRPWGSWRRA